MADGEADSVLLHPLLILILLVCFACLTCFAKHAPRRGTANPRTGPSPGPFRLDLAVTGVRIRPGSRPWVRSLLPVVRKGLDRSQTTGLSDCSPGWPEPFLRQLFRR